MTQNQKKIDILSLFPSYFQGPFDVSIIKRAVENKILEVNHLRFLPERVNFKTRPEKGIVRVCCV